jgi:glutamine synthetase
MGMEIEWYVLRGDGMPAHDDQRTAYLEACAVAMQSLPLHSLNAERGKGQVEAALWHTKDVCAIPEMVEALKERATEVAVACNMQACWAAKPFSHQHGSGVHVHIHLQDAAGELLYWKRGESLSPALAYSIGGLLASMQDDMPVFAGSEAAYARYAAGFDAPIAANWGVNNRTTAIRLPDGLGGIQGLEAVLASPPSAHRRIEHRVASSEADIESVLAAILRGVERGLLERIIPPQAVHGNAYIVV